MAHPVAYLRKSKSDDPSKEVSRDVQEQAARELAAGDGYNGELELFVDWDRSADEGKASRRTAYLAMLKRIEAGEVSVVYAYAVDRLYRSLSTFLRLTEAANAQGVRIVTTREGVIGGDGSPMAQAFAQIGAVFTELELNTAKARARAAHASRVRRGDHIGQIPYGYRLVKVDGVNRLETDPARPVAPIVEAYQRAAGRTRKAVRIVNDELRLPAPYGGTWDRPSLLRLITREAPHLLPPRTATGRREASATPASLAKLLRCHCGRLLTPSRHVERRAGRKSSSSLSYYCARGHAARNDHPRVYIAESAVLPWIKAEAARLRTPERVELAADNDGRREALHERRRRVIDNYEDALIDRAERDRKITLIDAELEGLHDAERLVEVPKLEWDWPPEQINNVLRALWHHVQLDEHLRPVEALWRVPTWRR